MDIAMVTANPTPSPAMPAGSATPTGEPTRGSRPFVPAVDILETDDELRLLVDLPGVTPGDVDLRFEQGELTISAPVAQRQPEGTRFLVCEYGVGPFERTFRVSESIDAARIAAEMTDGVLTLHLPKSESAKPRKIAVQAV